MNINFMFTSIIFVSLFFLSCKQKDLPLVEPPESDVKSQVFEIVWATAFNGGEKVASPNWTINQYSDLVLQSGPRDNPASILAVDKRTGIQDLFYQYSGPDTKTIDYAVIAGNIYIGTTGRRVFGLDLNSKTVLWELDLNVGALDLVRSRGVLKDENTFYFLGDRFFQTNNQTRVLLKIDVQTGVYEEVLHMYPDSEGISGISPPAWWTNPETGQELMVVVHHPNFHAGPDISYQTVQAYDAQTFELVWESEHLVEKGASNILSPPAIYESIAIVGAGRYLVGLDLISGSISWKTGVKVGYTGGIWHNTDHLIRDGKIYANSASEEIVCLDALTGQTLWNNGAASTCCTSEMIYYQDMIITVSSYLSSLFVYDALTGEELHREFGFEGSAFYTNPIYDPELDLFFTSTFDYALGFKINKPE